MSAEIVVSVVGTLGVVAVGWMTYRGNLDVAKVRAENSSQHGTSQAVVAALADEVRLTRGAVDRLSVMALASSEEIRVRHRIQLAFSDDAWYETDADGKCVWVNQAWAAMAQCTIEDALGFGWGNYLDPDDAKDVLEQWGYAVAHGRAFGPTSFRFTSEVAVMSRALPMFDPASTVTGYIGQAKRLSDGLEKRTEQP